jgi:TPR repeat protein
MKEIDWLEKGLVHYDKKEYEQAVECFRKGDKAGDSECTEYLGLCHQWGYGVELDLHKAAFYNEKAAKAENADAPALGETKPEDVKPEDKKA